MIRKGEKMPVQKSVFDRLASEFLQIKVMLGLTLALNIILLVSHL